MSSNLPHLTQPQATVLALWSYGIAMTRSCGRGTVATFLAMLVGGKVATVEQRHHVSASARARGHGRAARVWFALAVATLWMTSMENI